MTVEVLSEQLERRVGEHSGDNRTMPTPGHLARISTVFGWGPEMTKPAIWLLLPDPTRLASTW